jgi:hypothetical protein
LRGYRETDANDRAIRVAVAVKAEWNAWGGSSGAMGIVAADDARDRNEKPQPGVESDRGWGFFRDGLRNKALPLSGIPATLCFGAQRRVGSLSRGGGLGNMIFE